MQPAIYSTVRNQVDQLLEENVAARLDPARRPEYLLKPLSEWADLLDELHGSNLEPRYTEAITGYLHDAGILYYIKDHNNAAVMLDQSWACLLYTSDAADE